MAKILQVKIPGRIPENKRYFLKSLLAVKIVRPERNIYLRLDDYHCEFGPAYNTHGSKFFQSFHTWDLYGHTFAKTDEILIKILQIKTPEIIKADQSR